MKIDEKSACGGEHRLHGKANKELKNKRCGHMLFAVSLAWITAVMAVLTAWY